MTANRWQELRNTKTYDLLIAAPLALLYALAFCGLILQFAEELSSFASIRWSLIFVLSLSLNIVTALYLAIVIYLLAIRRIPVAKSDGALPRVIALIGANFTVSLLALPHLALPLSIMVLSLLVSTLGTGAQIAVLTWLGRSFSVFPEARKLVMGGPYRWVRHPVYLTGTIASLGVSLQFEQPWSLLIVLADFGFQLLRMHFEEAVLVRTFPEYTSYAAKTARLIPGVY
jgi:protein-S-isoprenylcysteine O-methyltransferase Ste14